MVGKHFTRLAFFPSCSVLGCGNTMPNLSDPNLSDLVPFHSSTCKLKFFLLVLGQLQMYKVNNKILYFIF